MPRRSSVTGKYVTKKEAKSNPAGTVKENDWAVRALRKVIQIIIAWDKQSHIGLLADEWKFIYKCRDRLHMK